MNAGLNLYVDYVAMLARICASHCTELKQTPEDLTQQTLLRAQAAWDRLRCTETNVVKAWLKRILANVLCEWFRHFHADKRDIRKEQSIDAIVEQSSARIEAFLPPNTSTPSRSAVRAEREMIAMQNLAKLPEDQRVAIQLRHIEGLTLKNIAQRMNRSPASVTRLLQAGMEALRKLMPADLR